MQVFNAYFKVIKKNLPQIFIYLGIFLLLSILLSNLNQSTSTTTFTQSKIKMALFNDDTLAYQGDSDIVKGLKAYLAKNAKLVVIEDQVEKIQDALFFRNVEYIARIPAGFTSRFLKAEMNLQIEKSAVPGSTSAIYVDLLINKYINTAYTYLRVLPNISPKDLSRQVQADLLTTTDVALRSFDTYTGNTQSAVYYYNYLAYSLFAILILGISAFMIVFRNIDIKRRNLCSPVTMKSMNFQILLGNIVFALATYLILIGFSFVLYGKDMMNWNGALFCVNAFVFTLAAMSISFLISNLATESSISAVTNVVTLGTCFLSGVFVPQQFLGDTVLTVASFTPTFWFVKANNTIGSMVNFSQENVSQVGGYMAVQVGFAIAVLIVTYFIIKKSRRTKS